MKNLILYLFIIGLIPTQMIWGQCNLLRNADFEQYSPCPTYLSQIHYATNWFDANVAPNETTYPSSDYYNCGYSGIFSAPSAHTGTGFVGLNVGSTSTTAAEMIGTCVKLVSGQTYTFSMWIYGGDGSTPFYIQGVPTSTFPVPRNGNYCPTTATTLLTIPAAHCVNTSWTFRTYTFTSPGNYNAIIIGGVCSGTTTGINYINLDDVSLTANAPAGYASLSSNVTSVPCGGGNATLTFRLPGGCLGPYNVTYTVNGSPTTLTGINDGHTVSLPVSVTSTVVLTNVTNNDGCTFNPSGSVTITTSAGVNANAGSNFTTTCTNTTAALSGSASGGTAPYTYSWNNGIGATQNPTVNPASTTTYTLTVTDNAGCTDTDQSVVTVNKTPPSVSTNANQTTTCTTPSATITGTATGGSSPYTYLWNNGAGTSSSATVNPSSNTTYTLTATGANGCSASSQVSVTVNKAVPTVSAGLDKTTTCTSPTAVLNGSASGGSTPYSYAWNNGAGTTQAPTVNPTSNTNYTLTVTGANGCSATDQAAVTVNKAAPTAEAGASSTTTCTTPTATLSGSATGGTTPYTYLWNNSAGTSPTSTVNPAATTVYTLTVTGANGCTDTDQATVTVDKTLPNANAGANINLDCATTTGTFTATGGGTYSWNTPAGTSTGNTVSVTDASATGNYTVTVTGANGCVDTDLAVLSIDQTLPVADAGTDQISNCATPTVTLNGTGSSGTGIIYAWTGPNVTGGGSTNTATADTPGIYTLTVTGSNGCTDSDQVTVNPDNNYPVADAGTDQVIDCNTSSVTLDGSGSDAGATITYTWSTTGGNITGGTTSNTTTSDLDGTYTLTVTNSGNGCSSSDAVIVTQDTVTPVVSLNSGTYVIDCNNPTATFDASLSTGAGNSFAWTTSDGNIVSGATTANPVVDIDGNYNLVITAANGCDNLSSTTVVVSIDTISPTIAVQVPDTLTCLITSTTLDASTSQAGVTYDWTTLDGNILSGATTATPTVDTLGNYLLTITSSNGCTSSLITTVVNSPEVSTQIIANPILGEIPLDVDFSEISTGNGLTYFWEFGTGDTDSVATTSYTYNDIDTYQVYLTVIDQYGCVAIDSITIDAVEVSAVIIPNIFTPNGDGTNDIFKVTASSIKNLSAQIVNRWGQIVYEWDTAEGGWDGHSASGVPSTTGTYYYFISVEFLDGKIEEFKGPLMLEK